MIIGEQMPLRRPVFAPSVVTLPAVSVVLWKANRVFNDHSRVHHAPTMSTYSCWTTSTIWTVSHCRPVGSWMDISTDYCTCWAQCTYRWCVAAFSSGLWNIPTPLDQVLDGLVVQMHINIDTLWEQQWPPKQHSGKKSGYSAVVKESTGEWNVFSDESRFCLCARDGCKPVWRRPGEHHLLECIRPRCTGPTLERFPTHRLYRCRMQCYQMKSFTRSPVQQKCQCRLRHSEMQPEMISTCRRSERPPACRLQCFLMSPFTHR